MWEIKEYKELLIVELKDGTILRSAKTLDELEISLNSNSQVFKIDGVLFNRYQFKKAYTQKVDEIEGFILSHDKDVQERLRSILRERKEKHFNTNGISHLWDIYISRYWE